MQIDPNPNPYQAPTPEGKKEKPPFLEPLIQRARRAAAIGTLLSAPSIAIAASSAEYHDKKPISVSGFVEHVVDWTTKLAPLGYGVPFLAEFSGSREIKKNED